VARVLGLLLALAVSISCYYAVENPSGSAKGTASQSSVSSRKSYKLEADDFWQVELPTRRRFDASGLSFLNGKLLTISDRSSELWWLDLSTNHVAQVRQTGWFTLPQMQAATHLRENSYDCEGIAVDNAANLYISEEKTRSIFKWDAKAQKVEKLAIDWTPARKFFSVLDNNASFEGIAIGGGKLWVANERSEPRLFEVDLQTLQVVTNFYVDASGFAFGGPHYSDLSWFDDHLFVLDRNHRVILEVDPTTKKVIAEYDFAQMELQPEFAYHTAYPTGTMEGLTVDKDYFWLITDNNGEARYKNPRDTRPTLFRSKRPKQ
jgi:uncharacterized protein YjiK